MKRSPSATTRSRSSGEARISLFPFLAVLLCTMGALIVVLVVIARQARLQAEQLPIVAEKSQALKDLETARDMTRWRITELKASREKTEAQLTNLRLQLGGLEDHIQKLRASLSQFKTSFAQLKLAKGTSSQQRAQQQSELARLRSQIEEAKQELAKAQQQAKQSTSYAVIPYEGPNGTHRRPIYLECRRDGIVLQPEGLVFSENDFNGPLGPGNPLDVALRAYREYLLERKQIAADGSNEPYPLLLVRPSGISAYYLAQAAMKSWNSEFGYELIGEDWNLEFQPPDRTLAEKVEQLVNVARMRQQRLAQAVPRLSESRSQPKYRAAPYSGGVIRDDSEGEDKASAGLEARQPARPFGNRVDSTQFPAEDAPLPPDRALTDGSSNREKATTAATNPTTPSAHRSHPLRGVLPSQTADVKRSAEQDGSPLRPGEWHPQPPTDKSQKAASQDNASEDVPCLAKTRGENWGLRNASERSIPLTRPIRIDLYADRLIIVPERKDSEAKVIPLGPRTIDAIDSTISAIWDTMDSWGIAGKGMYWRPILDVYVAPEAEFRYRDLAILLEGSGMKMLQR